MASKKSSEVQIEMPIVHSSSEPKKREPSTNYRSKYQRSGFLSSIHFLFALDTFLTANQLSKQGKIIESEEHVSELGTTEQPSYFEAQYYHYYQQYKKDYPNKKPSMVVPLFKTHTGLILRTFFVRGSFLAIGIGLSLLLKQLLDSLANPNKTVGDAFIWAGASFVTLLVRFYVHHNWFFTAAVLSVYIKSGLISMIYSKINKVSLYSINKLSLGKVINVVANDVNVFERSGQYFFSVPLALPALVGATAVVWSFYGVTCLVGVGFILAVYPFQQILARATMKPRDLKNKVTDERVKLVNEIIEAIRLIKMYAWELIFNQTVVNQRKKESDLLKKIVTTESIARAISCSTHIISSFLIFLIYVATGGELTVGTVFPTVFLMSFIKHHIVLFVSYGFNFLAEVQLILDRVVHIMELPEIDIKQTQKPIDPQNAVEFDNFSGFWSKEEPNTQSKSLKSQKNLTQAVDPLIPSNSKPALMMINLKIKKGTLNSIVGKIGCGKSSLLLAFTGEMPKVIGSIRFEGRVAYVEQEPIIFPGTLQDNIILGEAYDAEFFNRVAEACCLINDFKILPLGQKTEIGERGINLSGGQKARVALARALYSQSDIYLLDDPLSAVDTKVAKVIYEKAIKELLKDKTVLLVTHQTHFVKNCENIIVMNDGEVVASGSHEEIERNGFDLQHIFVSTAADHKNSENMLKNPKKSININKDDQEEEAEADGEGENIKAIKDKGDQKKEEGALDQEKGKLVVKEDMHAARVTAKTYIEYTKASFNKFMLAVTILIFVGNELANVAYTRILGAWANKSLGDDTSMISCGCIVFGILVIYIVKNIIYNYKILDGSETLHNRMLERTLRNPIEFFDTNPVGRILNRFSNDVGVLDRFLPACTFDVVEAFFFFSGVLITVWVINPLVLIPNAVLVVALTFCLRFCLNGITQIKGYELVTKSPVYSLFSVTLSGLVVVRSFNQSEEFKRRFGKTLVVNTKASFAFWASTRLFGFMVDYLSTIIAIISIAIVTASKNSDSGLSGLSITFILNLTEYIQYNVRQAVQTNQLMASTARIISYCNTKTEASLSLESDKQLTSWPTNSSIDIKDVFMKYRTNTDFVLRKLSLDVKPGEKIGCVGRTGAGKSSIIQMLFRMVEIDKTQEKESYVKIDGVDTMTVGLHLLRKNISIIPQTPVVFTGSVRRNLDPLREYTDEELWRALEEVRLKEYVEKLNNKLDTDMTNVASVFSVGQKQLICLARAILRKSKIIVLDEATANVDFETDNFIQEKIMEKFSPCTVFTIAHRLSTIANYDKVLVLDKGVKVEFDTPYKLLVKEINDTEITNKEGYFASMVLSAGPKASKSIFEICKAKYFHDMKKLGN